MLLTILGLPNHTTGKVELHVVCVVVSFVRWNLSLGMLRCEVAELLVLILDDDVWVVRLEARTGFIDA